MSFHERLKQAREQTKLTQEDVANMLGIAKSTYSGYETGKSEPSMDKIASLMTYFSVSADWLMQDEMQHRFESEHPMRFFDETWEKANSTDENELLAVYRALTPTGKESALAMIHGLATNSNLRNDAGIAKEA